jgi:hypothetical protein
MVVAQVVEHLHSKLKALSSHPIPKEKKKQTQKTKNYVAWLNGTHL